MADHRGKLQGPQILPDKPKQAPHSHPLDDRSFVPVRRPSRETTPVPHNAFYTANQFYPTFSTPHANPMQQFQFYSPYGVPSLSMQHPNPYPESLPAQQQENVPRSNKPNHISSRNSSRRSSVTSTKELHQSKAEQSHGEENRVRQSPSMPSFSQSPNYYQMYQQMQYDPYQMYNHWQRMYQDYMNKMYIHMQHRSSRRSTGNSHPNSSYEPQPTSESPSPPSHADEHDSVLNSRTSPMLGHHIPSSDRITPRRYSSLHSFAKFSQDGTLVFVDIVNSSPSAIHCQRVIDNYNVVNDLFEVPAPFTTSTHRVVKSQVRKYLSVQSKRASKASNIDADYVLLLKYLTLLLDGNGMTEESDLCDLLVGDFDNWSGDLEDLPLSDPLDNLNNTSSMSNEGNTNLVMSRLRNLLILGRHKDCIDLAIKEDCWGFALRFGTLMGAQISKEVAHQFDTCQIQPTDCLQTFINVKTQTGLSVFESKVSGFDWKQHLAVVISSASSEHLGEYTCVIGDALASREMLYASHLCYCIARCNFGYPRDETSKLVLLGAISGDNGKLLLRDKNSIFLSLIYEYCIRLHFHTFYIPFLQVCKLWLAIELIEIGGYDLASQYCDSACLIVSENYDDFSPSFIAKLLAISEHIFQKISITTPAFQKLSGFTDGYHTANSNNQIAGQSIERSQGQFLSSDPPPCSYDRANKLAPDENSLLRTIRHNIMEQPQCEPSRFPPPGYHHTVDYDANSQSQVHYMEGSQPTLPSRTLANSLSNEATHHMPYTEPHLPHRALANSLSNQISPAEDSRRSSLDTADIYSHSLAHKPSTVETEASLTQPTTPSLSPNSPRSTQIRSYHGGSTEVGLGMGIDSGPMFPEPSSALPIQTPVSLPAHVPDTMRQPPSHTQAPLLEKIPPRPDAPEPVPLPMDPEMLPFAQSYTSIPPPPSETFGQSYTSSHYSSMPVPHVMMRQDSRASMDSMAHTRFQRMDSNPNTYPHASANTLVQSLSASPSPSDPPTALETGWGIQRQPRPESPLPAIRPRPRAPGGVNDKGRGSVDWSHAEKDRAQAEMAQDTRGYEAQQPTSAPNPFSRNSVENTGNTRKLHYPNAFGITEPTKNALPPPSMPTPQHMYEPTNQCDDYIAPPPVGRHEGNVPSFFNPNQFKGPGLFAPPLPPQA